MKRFVSCLVIAILSGALVAPAQAHATRIVDYRSVVSTLREEIPAMMAESGAVGLTIALVDGSRTVMSEGFGYANREAATPVTADTLFHIGSTSKTLTALAIMQLSNAGLVDIDAPLSRYVPEFRLLPRFRDSVITVRSVLDHHSGIPGDVFNGMITSGRPDPSFRTWLKSALSRMYPEGPVNTVFAYNNSGYVLLQDVVENVTGQPFDSYAREHLFGPMGMSSSRFDDTRAPANRLTRNYEAVGPASSMPAVAKPREFVNGWTAGSVTSSSRDMAKYLKTLLALGTAPTGTKVIEQTTLEGMWTRQVDTPLDITPTAFGLGFGVGDYELAWAGRTIWHDGATVWNRSMMKLLPDAGLAVFVSANTATDEPVAAAVATRALAMAYTAKTGVVAPAAAPVPTSPVAENLPEGLADRVGLYAGTDRVLRLALVDGALRVTSRPGTPEESSIALRPRADGCFVPATADLPLYCFETVEGRHLLVASIQGPTGGIRLIAGQRVPASSLTPQWRSRLGTYRAVNADPTVDWTLLARTIVLRELDGSLVMDLDNEMGTQALVPGRSGAAFTFGMGTSVARGKGDAVIPRVTTGGVQTLTYLGVTYVREGAQ